MIDTMFEQKKPNKKTLDSERAEHPEAVGRLAEFDKKSYNSNDNDYNSSFDSKINKKEKSKKTNDKINTVNICLEKRGHRPARRVREGGRPEGAADRGGRPRDCNVFIFIYIYIYIHV